MKKLFFIITVSMLIQAVDAQWMSHGPYGGFVNCIAATDSTVFAGTPNGVFLSTDHGASWAAVNSGLTGTNVYALLITDRGIFAGSEAGVYFSGNSGAAWTRMSNGLPAGYISTITAMGNIIFAAGNGVSISTDGGVTWIDSNKGLTNENITTMAVTGATVFVGTLDGIFVSVDSGATWSGADAGLTSAHINSILVKDSTIFEGGDAGVSMSANMGAHWSGADSGLTSNYDENNYPPEVNALVWAGSGLQRYLFAGTNEGTIFFSDNNGASWQPASTGLPPTSNQIFALAASGQYVYAATGVGVFVSDNDGSTWADADSGLLAVYISSVVQLGSNVFAGSSYGALYRSVDNGDHWARLNVRDGNIILAVSETHILESADEGIFTSTDTGTTWLMDSLPFNLFDVTFAVNGATIFMGFGGGIFLSNDTGKTWLERDSGLNETDVLSVLINGSTVIAGSLSGVFISTDNGDNWVGSGLEQENVRALATSGFTVFAAVAGDGIFLSNNGGNTWLASNTGLATLLVNTLAVAEPGLAGNELEIFAGTVQGIYYSTNNGASWQMAGLPTTQVNDIITDNTYVFVGTSAGVWQRSLSGISTGIGLAPSNSISIYPNPATSELMIKVENFIPQSLTIYDMDGRKITGGGFTPQVDISLLSSGSYFIEVRGEENIVVRKRFVKM